MKNNKKLTITIITVILAVILLTFWVFFAYIQLNSVDAGKYVPNAETKFIAHRGYSGKYYQNTERAFSAAANDSFFHGIETDVWRTADGVFVCCHDDDPFVDKTVKVTESNYEDIKDLPLDLSDAGENVDLTVDYKLCALSDYLKQCNRSRKLAVVELKQELTEGQLDELMEYLLEEIPSTRLLMCSFKKGMIDYIYDAHPYLNIMLFTASTDKAYRYAELGYNVGLNKKIVDEKKVSRCHKREVFLNVYTINDAEEARSFVDMDVDYITTDEALW